jgi:hypothetical protein
MVCCIAQQTQQEQLYGADYSGVTSVCWVSTSYLEQLLPNLPACF